jgi:hypothetical protein
MKKLILVIAVLLSGCAFIFPKPHDPVMFDRAIAIDIKINKINCSNKDWDSLIDDVHHLKVYTEVRGDPQSKGIAQLEEALTKAKDSKSEKFCESIINLQKTRIKVVQDAWRGR